MAQMQELAQKIKENWEERFKEFGALFRVEFGQEGMLNPTMWVSFVVPSEMYADVEDPEDIHEGLELTWWGGTYNCHHSFRQDSLETESSLLSPGLLGLWNQFLDWMREQYEADEVGREERKALIQTVYDLRVWHQNVINHITDNRYDTISKRALKKYAFECGLLESLEYPLQLSKLGEAAVQAKNFEPSVSLETLRAFHAEHKDAVEALQKHADLLKEPPEADDNEGEEDEE